jgi:hypothetical protein
MRRRIVCILATVIAVAFCYLKTYDISPTHYSLSGWTDSIAPNNWVAETFIADFDSAAEVWWFVGDVGNPGNAYDVEIKDYETDVVVAHSYGVVARAKGHVWVPFPMTPVTLQKIVRGKEYKVVVTRPGRNVGLDFRSAGLTIA